MHILTDSDPGLTGIFGGIFELRMPIETSMNRHTNAYAYIHTYIRMHILTDSDPRPTGIFGGEF